MCINKVPGLDDLKRINKDTMIEITNYIHVDKTATTISRFGPPSRDIVTSEIIYACMIERNVPLECQKWHLSRLLILLEVLNIRANPKKNRMTKEQLADRNRKLNEKRRAEMNSGG